MEALNLDEYAAHGELQPTLHTPVTLADLEQTLTTASIMRHRFAPHETIQGAYWLTLDGVPLAVTFRAACYDEHPDSVHFLTYGSPVLTALSESVPAPEAYPTQLARFSQAAVLPICDWYNLAGGAPRPIVDLAHLTRLMTNGAPAVASVDDARSEALRPLSPRPGASTRSRSPNWSGSSAAPCRRRRAGCWSRPHWSKSPWGASRDCSTRRGIPAAFPMQP